jgi:hypothetical protein
MTVPATLRWDAWWLSDDFKWTGPTLPDTPDTKQTKDTRTQEHRHADPRR